MNIVNATRADTGGQGIRLSTAINETFPGIHTSRAFTGGLNYGKIPYDILYQKKWKDKGFPDEVMDLWKAADVYHLHHSKGWMKHWPLREMNPKAGVIMHIHGRPNAKRRRAMIREVEETRNYIRVVSTPCLLYLVKDNPYRWFPHPIDFPQLEKFRKENKKDDGIFRVIHAPTVNKDTKTFLEVMKYIERRYKNVETIVIHHQPQVRAWELKSVGDIHFNALHHGMGGNIFECMVMNIPSITGDWGRRYPKTIKQMHPTNTMPFVRALTKGTLYNAVEKLILSSSLREEVITAGRLWVEKYHTFEYTAKHAIKTYEEAIALRS